MARSRKTRGSKTQETKRKIPPPVSPPPPVESRAAVGAISVLTDEFLRDILCRLSLADLLRAALACHCWRHLVARCLPRDPPLLGYFFHPTITKPLAPPPIWEAERSHSECEAVFAPFHASSPRLSLDFAPGASHFRLYDCHQGLLLLQPAHPLPRVIHPRLLVLDPATHRRALLPTPPHDTVPDDHRWRKSRHYVGSRLLSRVHPSKLCFEAVCFAIDGGHPRAWVASFDGDQCRWRALPLAKDVVVDFDPYWFERRCVHAAGKMYWHICNSGRVLVLDPATLHFSYLLAPAVLGDHFAKYRIGQTPDDGRLCVVTVEDQVMQLWVRAKRKTRCSDNGWVLEREMYLRKVYDTVPGLPRDMMNRVAMIWIGDIDAGRTWKLFIRTWGLGCYSFDLRSGKLELLATKDGKEYGQPIFAYFLSWPPAFLAAED